MSRSGYSDECDDQWAMIRWRGAVASSLRGKRGQAFLREVLAALDAMPDKRLVGSRFEADGDCCTLGAVCRVRGVDASGLTPDYNQGDVSRDIADLLDIPVALAAEIMHTNDETVEDTRPERVATDPGDRRSRRIVWVPVPGAAEKRWQHMRDWVARHIIEPEAAK